MLLPDNKMPILRKASSFPLENNVLDIPLGGKPKKSKWILDIESSTH